MVNYNEVHIKFSGYVPGPNSENFTEEEYNKTFKLFYKAFLLSQRVKALK